MSAAGAPLVREGLDALPGDHRWGIGELEPAHEQHDPPGRVAVVVAEAFGWVGTHSERPRCCVADRRRLVEDPAQTRIGVELLTLHDPDGGELAGQLRVERLRRLQLHKRIEHLVVSKVVRRDRIDRQSSPSTKRGVLGDAS